MYKRQSEEEQQLADVMQADAALQAAKQQAQVAQQAAFGKAWAATNSQGKDEDKDAYERRKQEQQAKLAKARIGSRSPRRNA